MVPEVVERDRVGVLARVVVVEVLEFGVGEEVAFVGEEVDFVGEEVLLGVEEDGVAGSGNSLGWCRVDTMAEGEAVVYGGSRVASGVGPSSQQRRMSSWSIWRRLPRDLSQRICEARNEQVAF
jgi:hypothetical protein